MTANSRANGYCPVVPPFLRRKGTANNTPQLLLAVTTPAFAGNLLQGGFRASALPLRTFSDRHVIHSICRDYPPKRVLTGRLYLFRFAPRATFRPSAPRTRASTLSTIGVPPHRQLRRPAGCLAVDGVNYTRLVRHCQYHAITRRSSADTRSRHARAREAITGQSQVTAEAGLARSAKACGRLPIRI